MEIRRIEGIIPVEAVSRDLPLKLENFSYKDMKKLLSQITRKGEEFEELLLKATLLELPSPGRARIKLGNTVIEARLEAAGPFTPGQELLLRVKRLSPAIELSIVEPTSLLKAVKRVLPKLFEVNLRPFKALLSPQVSAVVLEEVKRELPELYPAVKAFIEGGELRPGRELLIYLLTLLKPEVYKRVKPYLPGELNRQRIKELLDFTVGAVLLYHSIKVLLLPISGEGFWGRALLGVKDGVGVAFIEGEGSLGEFKGAVRALKTSVSLEYWAQGELKRRFNPKEVEELLKEEGLTPVLIREVEAERLLKVKGELLKGSLVEFTV